MKLSAIRFVKYWTVPARPYKTGHYVNYVAYFSIAVLAFLGSMVALREGLPSALILSVVAFYPVAHYITIVGLYRYRYPMEPVLLVLAGLGLSRILSSLGCNLEPWRGDEAVM
jgi:hypothetical protein